ncbi:hypothetical protein [Rhodanobacter sp. MP7CTX1]|uniref:hypothetical protein n=1 Tax=Rhodanobacter sp. MP7CTX1 TaxID=2723084 RepID=UPI001614AB61|nr:hypothetical protein [Rhodanobacter sp. MP7CTX1]MBB6187934.1 hypothetical protein [Rhodanobacter sp. MP7CTX1]
MPLIVDASEEALAALLEKRMLRRAASRAATDLQALVDQRVKLRTGTASIVLQGAEAAGVLTDLIGFVEGTLHRWAGTYAPVHWLWLLRRIQPAVFEGALPTTLAYDSALAAVLTGASPVRGRFRFQERQLTYPLSDSDGERVWRFCAGVRFLSHLHQTYRWASKGAPIRFQRRGPIRPEPSEALRIAAERYDERVATETSFLSHSGTILLPEVGARESSITGVLQIDPTLIPIPDLPGVPIQGAQVSARYIPHTVDLDSLLELLLQEEPSSPTPAATNTAALVCLLAAFHDIVLQHGMLSGVLQRGYLLWGRERLFQTLADAFTRLPPIFQKLANSSGITSPDDWTRALQTMDGTAWPLVPGPVLRIDGEAAVLDLYFATMRLNALISETAQRGAAANARATQFEWRVQSAIDNSSWRPDTPLRDLRGRPLRRAGKAVTDIDALGVRGTSLLLVSCKSTLYSPQYDTDDHAVVRNRADLLSRAIAEWDQKVASFRSHPLGDNFDFSPFKEIWGVVCTPMPVFAPTEPRTSMAPAMLGAGCSFHELESWLARI